MKEVIEKLSFLNFTGLITIVGVYLAIFEYYAKSLSQKKSVIKSLKAQLNNSGCWASANSEGWIKDPDDSKKLSLTDPYYLVYNVEDHALKNISFLPGMSDFSYDVFQDLANYNQKLLSIHGHLEVRNHYVTNNLEKCELIYTEISKELEKTPSDRSYQKYGERIKNIDAAGERGLVMLSDQLYSHNLQIHYNLIGSATSGGLKELYHRLDHALTGQEKHLKPSVKINFFLFFLIFTFTITVFLFFNIQLYNWRNFIDAVLCSTIIFCGAKIQLNSIDE